MKKLAYVAIPLLIFLGIYFSSEKETIDQYQEEIDLRIKEKVDVFVQSRMADCMERVMKEADQRADSILRIKALDMFSQKISLDSSRLFKPNAPEIELPTDSVDIEPLFKDTLQ